MNIKNELLNNIALIHTTELGLQRISKNVNISTTHIVDWCKAHITDSSSSIVRKGKNWYISNNNIVITINAHSFTIITAHKEL